MKKRVIRLGDKTSHGGVVVSATSHFNVFGKPVARLGDSVACPVPGHGVCSIAEGDPTWTIDGIPVALEGHKTSCGASLISSIPSVVRSPESSSEAALSSSQEQVGAINHAFDLHFRLKDSLTGVPLARQPYRLEVDGKIIEGVTDNEGFTKTIPTGYRSKAVGWHILGEVING